MGLGIISLFTCIPILVWNTISVLLTWITYCMVCVCVCVHLRWLTFKATRYRPGQALRVPGGWGSQISRQSAYGGGKVVSPMHWLPLPPPRKYSWYSFQFRGWVNPRAIVWPEGFLGIEPATFRSVAQYLNQLHCVPHCWWHIPSFQSGT